MPRKTRKVTKEVQVRFDAAMERIKEVLDVRTQMEIAEMIGVRQSSISDAKRRCSIPSDWLMTIWRTTGISPDWIMDGDKCGHKYAVASMEPGELVNALAIREQVEAEVRAEVDNLNLGELLVRIHAAAPGVKITIEAAGPEFMPMGDPTFTHLEQGQ